MAHANGQDRNLVAELVLGALRAEHGVRLRQDQNRSTDYYAGRRSAYVASAARAASVLYGADYEQVKHVVSEGVKQAGEGMDLNDLVAPDTAKAAASVIAQAAVLS